MRMNADRKSALGPGVEDCLRPRDFGVVFGGENHERARHTGRARAFNNRIEIGDEFLAGDVAVAVCQGAYGVNAPVTWNW